MRAVLLSIHPKYCELIASGKKVVEVRKRKPKIDVPFKAYIYCTRQKVNGEILLTYDKKVEGRNRGFRDEGDIPIAGKVIGEFVCDEILDCRDVNMDDTCITVKEWLKYTKGHKGVVYGWHISKLIIYDKPKELSELTRFCDGNNKKTGCSGCEYYYTESNESIGFYDECCCNNSRPLERAPQSYCFVEELQK